MGIWVEAVRTPLTKAEATAFVSAEFARLGIPDRGVPLALAQLDLETAGFQAIRNNNVGNLKPGSSWGGDWYTVRVNERDAAGNLKWYSPEGLLESKEGPVIGERYSVPPGHPQTRFRAYSTPEKGFADWAKLLDRERFVAARLGLEQGDGEKFIRGLKAGGYFTATFDEYFRGFRERLGGYIDTRSRSGNRSRGGAGAFVGLLALVTGGFFLSRRSAPTRRRR